MSTETKNTTATIDNKALFGPLGRYAIIGVIMGSIIVTTAIMLDRQTVTATEHIAAIEKELAELNADESTAAAGTASAIESEPSQIQQAVEVTEAETSAVKDETVIMQTAVAPAVEQQVNKPAPANIAMDTVAATEDTVFAVTQTTEQTPVPTQAATIEPVKNEAITNYTAQTFHPQHAADIRDQEWDARIQAHKLEQKQYLSELFDQIKTLDSQRLEKYKVWQDEGIEHLREQIARQQELIEELMLRNKEAYEMREASMERQQTSRERLLDRI